MTDPIVLDAKLGTVKEQDDKVSVNFKVTDMDEDDLKSLLGLRGKSLRVVVVTEQQLEEFEGELH